jgi:hypothetical protein
MLNQSKCTDVLHVHRTSPNKVVLRERLLIIIALFYCCTLLLTGIASFAKAKVDRTSCNVSSWNHIAT